MKSAGLKKYFWFFRTPYCLSQAKDSKVCEILNDQLGLSYNMTGRFNLVIFFLLMASRASSGNTCTGTSHKKCTYVVNHSFCESSLPPEDKEGKKTLEEVHTYAELKLDRSLDPPDSFTICSTIMATECKSAIMP